jgi:hypothetical protein
MAQGPGPVAWAHRLLIATALAGALFYTAWEFRGYTSSGEPAALARAGLALVASGAMALYLRGLRARLAARLTPLEADRESGRAGRRGPGASEARSARSARALHGPPVVDHEEGNGA